MKKEVCVLVTIDTECDKGNPDWNITSPMTFKNIKLQETLLMPIFRKYDIIPTFLLSPEVLQDHQSVEIMKNLSGNSELGTHMHIEFIPPNKNFDAKNTNGIQATLPYEEEYAKLLNLTQLFIDKIGCFPKSYRSGRFASSKATTKILASLGYKVDSSVVPYTTKFFDDIYINSWNKPLEPYWERFLSKKILQVPITTMNEDYHKIPFFLKMGLGKPQSKSMKICKKIGYKMKTRWLRPYRENGKGLVEIADFIIKNHFKTTNFVLLNIMFHSNEILMNGSPYCKSQKEINDYLASLEYLFNYLKQKHKLCSTGLGEVSTIYYQN